MTRLDCTLGAAGGARRAVSLALNHCADRSAFGLPLVQQPMMQVRVCVCVILYSLLICLSAYLLICSLYNIFIHILTHIIIICLLPTVAYIHLTDLKHITECASRAMPTSRSLHTKRHADGGSTC